MPPLARVFAGLAVGLVGAVVALVTLPFCALSTGCGGSLLVFYDSVHHSELVEMFWFTLAPTLCGSVVSLPLLVLGVVIVLAGPRVQMSGVGGEADPDNVFDPPRREI